jgi:hypothetical protein
MSLADHLRPALGTDTVNAALTGYMRFFMPTLGVGANTVAAGAGAGFIAAALTSLSLTAACPLACVAAMTETIT